MINRKTAAPATPIVSLTATPLQSLPLIDAIVTIELTRKSLTDKQITDRLESAEAKQRNLSLKDAQGRSALHWAAKFRNFIAMKYLVNRTFGKPNLDELDNQGNTPLKLLLQYPDRGPYTRDEKEDEKARVDEQTKNGRQCIRFLIMEGSNQFEASDQKDLYQHIVCFATVHQNLFFLDYFLKFVPTSNWGVNSCWRNYISKWGAVLDQFTFYTTSLNEHYQEIINALVLHGNLEYLKQVVSLRVQIGDHRMPLDNYNLFSRLDDPSYDYESIITALKDLKRICSESFLEVVIKKRKQSKNLDNYISKIIFYFETFYGDRVISTSELQGASEINLELLEFLIVKLNFKIIFNYQDEIGYLVEHFTGKKKIEILAYLFSYFIKQDPGVKLIILKQIISKQLVDAMLLIVNAFSAEELREHLKVDKCNIPRFVNVSLAIKAIAYKSQEASSYLDKVVSLEDRMQILVALSNHKELGSFVTETLPTSEGLVRPLALNPSHDMKAVSVTASAPELTILTPAAVPAMPVPLAISPGHPDYKKRHEMKAAFDVPPAAMPKTTSVSEISLFQPPASSLSGKERQELERDILVLTNLLEKMKAVSAGKANPDSLITLKQEVVQQLQALNPAGEGQPAPK